MTGYKSFRAQNEQIHADMAGCRERVDQLEAKVKDLESKLDRYLNSERKVVRDRDGTPVEVQITAQGGEVLARHKVST